jgi:hypothetical protein
MFNARFLVVVLVTATFLGIVGDARGQLIKDSKRVPTPALAVAGAMRNFTQYNNAGYRYVHSAKLIAPQKLVELPKRPKLPAGVQFPEDLLGMRGPIYAGDEIAMVGVLQQGRQKSKYMYIILLNAGEKFNGWLSADFGGGPIDDKMPNSHAVRVGYSKRPPMNEGSPNAPGGARLPAGPPGPQFDVGKLLIDMGFDEKNPKFDLTIAHDFDMPVTPRQRTPPLLKDLKFKINEYEIKEGKPRVFLADFSGEKFKLTPVDAKLPQEGPNVQDIEFKTWGDTVKKTIDLLREQSSDVEHFMNTRTVQKVP